MKTIKTFNVKIYCGMKRSHDSMHYRIDDVINICEKYCNKTKLCVSITPTNYVYVGGREQGVIVGLINYARFPKNVSYIRSIAMELGHILLEKLDQKRLTIEFPDESIMLERDEEDGK